MKNEIFLILLLLGTVLMPKTIIIAEEDDATYCQIVDHMSEERCRPYYYEKLKDSNETIQNIEKSMADIKRNLDDALKQANEFLAQAESYSDDIATLAVQIKDLNTQIDDLTLQIENNRSEVESLNQRVLNRMRNSQKTMHSQPYLDFILGSDDFAELSRRLYGIEAIMKKDNSDRQSLLNIITKLEEDEKKLEEAKEEVDTKKKDLEQKQAEYYAKQELAKAAAAEFEIKLAEEQNRLDSERKNYAELAKSINFSGLPSSAGLLSPVPGASISAGTWYYPASFGGGLHLGVDYAVSKGTNIYSPANGVVIVSSDGCGDGYLGNSCSGNGGGVAYGGNQVIMMVAAGGSIYGISFSHLLINSPVGKGEIKQGDYVGRVGSSGNSTGPHCHIELFYLGEGEMTDLESDYLLRGYSLSFNCGWGEAALRRLCGNGVSAPCRLKPENYLGA